MKAKNIFSNGLGFDLDGNHDPMFEKYWPANLHLIGKDILQDSHGVQYIPS